MSLKTLQGENEPIQRSLVSLEASDLGENNTVQLPQVYSRPSLPIPTEAIARQEDVYRWPCPKGVNISHMDAEIGLRIGSDVPEALQPWEIRPSENGGPFATRTVLAWVLKGRDRRCDKSLRRVAATGCCNKSPRVTWKIIVTATEFCRCDLSHKFKLV